jgi:hypothetical protein
MSLTEHAERELRDAGLFDADSNYGGALGESVMELVKVFAAQGHSGSSAHMTISLFHRVASYKLLAPMKNPMVTGEYIDHSDTHGGNPVYQSTRLSSVFSEDGGKTWYDIDKRIPRWKRWLGVKRFYITFHEQTDGR